MEAGKGHLLKRGLRTFLEHGAPSEEVDHLLHLRWIRDSHSVWSDRPTFSVNFAASNLNDIQLHGQPSARAPHSFRSLRKSIHRDMNAVEASLCRSHARPARPAKERWRVTDAKACGGHTNMQDIFLWLTRRQANERWNVHDKRKQDLNRKLSMYTVSLSVRFSHQSLLIQGPLPSLKVTFLRI